MYLQLASAAASNTFNEALLKMSLNAQQCGNGTSASDIGVSIANVASVYKEIQDHHTNIVSSITNIQDANLFMSFYFIYS